MFSRRTSSPRIFWRPTSFTPRENSPPPAAPTKTILATGAQSPALLFNEANAEFKSGHLGKAIAGYRRAALLAPRDAELRANLAFVRNQVQGATVRENRWQDWFGQLSLNEWIALLATSLRSG